ncbi:MAG: hypothetical protein IT258_07915 [Saprospiraceae bacterium]|nr:hypothetical protein [Saprospiraceae bacterium]
MKLSKTLCASAVLCFCLLGFANICIAQVATFPPINYPPTKADQQAKMDKQAKIDTAIAKIYRLKKGTLVFRLSTGSSTTKALQKLIDSPDVLPKDRDRYQKMLEKTRAEVSLQNQDLIASLREKYSFSKLIFMPDTAATRLKNGIREGIFVNDNMELDPTISLEGGFLVSFYGHSQSDLNTNNEGINIIDHQLQNIPYPFPSFVGRTSIRRMFEEFFNKATSKEHFDKLVGKFQQQLIDFYAENVGVD